MDSISRFLPGVLGNAVSCLEESLQNNALLEPPQYTKPRQLGEQSVPPVLLSGHHKKIQEFKNALSIVVTRKKRPDLFEKSGLAKNDYSRALELVISECGKDLSVLGLDLDQLESLIND